MKGTWFTKLLDDVKLADSQFIHIQNFPRSLSENKVAQTIAETLQQQFQLPCEYVEKNIIALRNPCRHTGYLFAVDRIYRLEDKIIPYTCSSWEREDGTVIFTFIEPQSERNEAVLTLISEDAAIRGIPFESIEERKTPTRPAEQRLRAQRKILLADPSLLTVLPYLNQIEAARFMLILSKYPLNWIITSRPIGITPTEKEIGTLCNYHLTVDRTQMIYVGAEGLDRHWGAFLYSSPDGEDLRIVYHDPDWIGIASYESLGTEIRLKIAPIIYQAIRNQT